MPYKLPIINTIEFLLKVKASESTRPEWWHKSALDVLFGDHVIRPSIVLSMGQRLLEDFPDGHLSSALSRAGSTKKVLKSVSDDRKLLMIARDTIKLCAESPLSKEFDPLFTLTKSLGQVVDSRGKKLKHTKTAFTTIAGIKIAAHAPLAAVDQNTLESRIESRLYDPLLFQNTHGCSEDVYHRARRRFRAVSHFAIMAAAADLTDERISFAASGRVLNIQYGAQHASLHEPVGMATGT